MSAGGGTGVPSFLAGYVSALTDYLRDPSERSLRVAYELGREAVSRQLSMLDLAVVHQEALLSALADVSGSEETQRVTRATGDFFLESLASFEMVQRGFREAKEAARLERRQTEMSRQLSTFLADASLALDASESLEEMLRLVAEQARELVGAAVLRCDGGDGGPAAHRRSRLVRPDGSALGRLREVARPVRDLPVHPHVAGGR